MSEKPRSPRRIYVGLEETETPDDLKEGEVVEAIRLGGPRDGSVMGRYRVHFEGEGVRLEWVEGGEWGEGGEEA